MKTKSKALLMTLCAVLLVAASVLGTMAYLTSTDKVTNTFTVGQIHITLDEAPVNVDGEEIDGARREWNAYKLVPGHEYKKDPTVHVQGGSENSWIFVKVENGIAAYEAAGTTTIAAQIEAKGWTALTGETGVYYKTYTKAEAETKLVVFDNFTIAEGAEAVPGWADAINANITITAYAGQKDNLDVNAAWDAAKALNA